MWTLSKVWLVGLIAMAALWLLHRAWRRLELSRAKHPSLAGHAKMSRRLAAALAVLRLRRAAFFACDGAPAEVGAQRRAGFARLAADRPLARSPRRSRSATRSRAACRTCSSRTLPRAVPVPRLRARALSARLRRRRVASGVELRDLDGHWSYDLSGSYGVNVFGYDFYKECIAAGASASRTSAPCSGRFIPSCATMSSA